MTVLDAPITVAVEGTAKILRGVAVPYGKPTVVGDRDPSGNVVVYRERFDKHSVAAIPRTMIPLLQSHDETRPIGKVTSMWHADTGLQLEAELVGSSSEIESVREKVGHGVMSSLSIGFYSDPSLDVWEQATTPGALPSVTRRGVKIRECSLVIWPAYPQARITALRNRTERQLESDKIIGEHRARKEAERAELDRFIAEQRAERQRRHEESERIKAAAAELLQESKRLSAEIAQRPQRRNYW